MKLTAKDLLKEVRRIKAEVSEDDQVVVIAEVRSGKLSYTRGEILDMLDGKGNVKPGYENADNLPKWILIKGFSQKMDDSFGGTRWVSDPSAKEFLRPFGMKPWRKLNDNAMKKVGVILQFLAEQAKPMRLDVRSTV